MKPSKYHEVTLCIMYLFLYQQFLKNDKKQSDGSGSENCLILWACILETEHLFIYFCFLGNGAGRSMRYDKRYIALPSPLTGVVFWRICLDEAQMVESTTAKVSLHWLSFSFFSYFTISDFTLHTIVQYFHNFIFFLFVSIFPFHISYVLTSHLHYFSLLVISWNGQFHISHFIFLCFKILTFPFSISPFHIALFTEFVTFSHFHKTHLHSHIFPCHISPCDIFAVIFSLFSPGRPLKWLFIWVVCTDGVSQGHQYRRDLQVISHVVIAWKTVF